MTGPVTVPARCLSGRCGGRRPVVVVAFGDLSESALCLRCFRHEFVWGSRPVLDVRGVGSADARTPVPTYPAGVGSASRELPEMWSSQGWTLGHGSSALLVFSPCGRLAGDVLRRFDGRWSASGVYPPGTTYRAVRDTAYSAVAVLCAWWTSKEYRTGGAR